MYPSNKSQFSGHVPSPDQGFSRHEVHLPQLQHQLVQELQVAALEQYGVALDDVTVLVTGHLHTQGVWQGSQDARAV